MTDDGRDDEPERVLGAFDPETRTIYLAPDLLDGEDVPKRQDDTLSEY